MRVQRQATIDVVEAAESRPVVSVPLESFRPSSFQPPGRPSRAAIDAVEDAIRRAGSLDRLVGPEGAGILARLDREARELAELTADVAVHGVESPLEVRRTASGSELLTGHRRLTAARLAGVTHVPVRDLGEIADHEAAAIVFRRNRLRQDFTPWQQARALQQLQECRRAAGLGEETVRELGRIMGYSTGRASELLAMARAFPPDLLTAVGDGSAARGDEILSSLPYRTLRELIRVADPARRVRLARKAAGLETAHAPASPGRTVPTAFRRDARRGGGFSLVVTRPVDQLTPMEARSLLEVLEQEAAQVRRVLDRAAS